MPKPTPSGLRLLACGVVLLIVGFVLWGSSGFPTTAEICDQASQAKVENCPSYNIVLVTLWHLREALNSYSGAIAALATIAIAGFTWTLWRSTEKLWGASERQLRQAQSDSSMERLERTLELRQLEEQVETLREGTQATRALVRVSNETAKRELRAYVLVSGAKIRSPGQPLLRRAVLTIRNYGKTPAHNLRFWMGTGVREFPLRSVLEEPPDSLRVSNDVLPPGRPSEMIVPVNPGMPDLEIGLIIRPPSNATSAIYLFGCITYLDAFDEEHVTEFRHMCWGDGFAEGKVSPCEDGNSYT